jgi:hypothetical protein
VVQSHANDDFPVTLGSQVRWYPKAERWRIEVTDPQTMKAVWITHEALRRIVEADTLGAELVSGWFMSIEPKSNSTSAGRKWRTGRTHWASCRRVWTAFIIAEF